MTTTLTFHTTTFSIIDRDGQPWLKSAEIAKALGYSRSDKISKLYTANRDEFTSAMTETLESRFSDNLRSKTRIFSLRGAHLLAMFARTPLAAEFRRWVLDILDRETQLKPQPETTLPASNDITPLVADPYQPYREVTDLACKVAALHGRGALVALLAQFDAKTLYQVPVSRLPEFVAICQKITHQSSHALPSPVEEPKPKPKSTHRQISHHRQWRDPAKAEGMLIAMRLKLEEMYDFSLITPERAEWMHQVGVIGPRQIVKLRRLMMP